DDVHWSFVGPFSEPADTAQFFFREPGLGHFIVNDKCTIHIETFSIFIFFLPNFIVPGNGG
ncbi:unnamed protein product, partial [marine sediment metagenome]